jgi:hypothetical protein
MIPDDAITRQPDSEINGRTIHVYPDGQGGFRAMNLDRPECSVFGVGSTESAAIDNLLRKLK